MCSIATLSGREVCDLGNGGEVEGSGVERCIVLGEVSMLLFVAQVVTGFGEVAAMRRFLGAALSTGCKGIGIDVVLSSFGASLRVLTKRSGACPNEEGATVILALEEGIDVVLSWSCGTARAEAELS